MSIPTRTGGLRTCSMEIEARGSDRVPRETERGWSGGTPIAGRDMEGVVLSWTKNPINRNFHMLPPSWATLEVLSVPE